MRVDAPPRRPFVIGNTDCDKMRHSWPAGQGIPPNAGLDEVRGRVSTLLFWMPRSPRAAGARGARRVPASTAAIWRNTVKTLKISALALFSALTLAACGDDGGTGPGGLRVGQFEGEIRGVLDTGLAGDAESGYYSIQGLHDFIVLTDYARGVQINIFESEDEFFEGRWTIEDEGDFDSRIVAWVEDLETGETFGSVSGTLDLDRVRGGGIEGSATFTAESDDVFGDFITVDVVFNTDYAGGLGFNLSPSSSVRAKVVR